MAFENLQNIAMTENLLLEKIISEVQVNYFKFENLYFFIKIEKANKKLTKATVAIPFTDYCSFKRFYFNTEFDRACVLIKYVENKYELLFRGYKLLDRMEILPAKTSGNCPIVCDLDYLNVPMPSHELIERGFGELAETLCAAKRKKAM